jgi:ferredoxin
MVTLEEEHSTRGRAHMLSELLRGDVLHGGWNDEQVKHSLDLCLSCKACKSECPTNVDIATYRAEFLSHYYETHRRPLHAYAFGMVDRCAGVGQYDDAGAWHHPDREKGSRHGAAEEHASSGAGEFSQVRTRALAADGRRRRHPLGRYLQQLVPSGNEPGGV